MKTKILLTSCLAALLFAACTPTTTTTENKETTETTTENKTPEPEKPNAEDSKIAEADALMQKIEADKATQKIEKKRFMNTAMNMAHDQSLYTVYSAGDKMVKLTELMGESMYDSEANYYYQDGNIFLVHIKSSYDGNLYSDTKIYLAEGKPFAALGKSKEAEDMSTDFAALKIEKKNLTEVIANVDEYTKSLAAIPARLAAAKKE